MPEYINMINDSTFMLNHFCFRRKDILGTGNYHVKSVVMNRYNKSFSVIYPEGYVSYENNYKIRVLTDSEIIDKHEF